MINLSEWALKWGVPWAGLDELRQKMGVMYEPEHQPGKSEAAAQAEVRLEGAKKGVWLTRNNVGALQDARGVPVRYGLANESKEQNKNSKSSDLIGIRSLLIQPSHIGQVVGVFVAREMKAPGWTYKGDAHEEAQLNFLKFVISKGGDASFATGVGTL